MHLLLEDLLLSLKLILTSLKLSKVGSGLLSLSSLILLHPLKNSNESGVCLLSRWAELELPASASCLRGGI